MSMDAVFDEDFTSPLSTPDLPFTGAIRSRDVKSSHHNDNIIVEHTGKPTGHIQTFGNRSDSSSHDMQDTNTRTLRPRKSGRKPTNNDSTTKITAFLANISKPADD